MYDLFPILLKILTKCAGIVFKRFIFTSYLHNIGMGWNQFNGKHIRCKLQSILNWTKPFKNPTVRIKL